MRHHLPIFHRPFRRAPRRGFTLIEAAIVTVIIGVGVVATVQLLAAGTMANGASAELTTAINLAGNIREMVEKKSFTDALALNGANHSPPVDAMNLGLPGMDNWRQRIAVNKVDAGRMTLVVPNSTDTPYARVTATIEHNGKTVYQTSWLIVNTQ